MKRNRILWIDAARGFAILCAVANHSIVSSLRDNAVYFTLVNFLAYLCMPLFFFLSGLLFEKKSDISCSKSRLIGRKFVNLMVPYFSFSIIYYAIIMLAVKIPSLSSMAQMGTTDFHSVSVTQFLFQVFTYQGSLCKSLWFLYVLFIIYAANILLPKIMKHPAAVAVLLILPFITCFVYPPTLISYLCMYSVFFAVGRIAAPHTERLFTVKKTVFAAVCSFTVIFGAAVFCLKYFGIFESTPMRCLLMALRIIFGLLCIFSVCTGCSLISKTKFSRSLSFIGTHTMEIYLLHFPFITQALTAVILKLCPFVPSPFACLAGIAAGIAVPILISFLIINRIPILKTLLLGILPKRSSASTRNSSRQIDIV